MADRFGQKEVVQCDDAYALSVLLGPASLIGANGMRVGPDRRLYVAQAFGNQISAIDTASGAVDIISAADGAIIAPDDLAFDSHGSLYATEVMSGRVSALRPNGRTEVIAPTVPVANGVTVHDDRIFVSEFRPGGCILEVFADKTPPRIIASDMMMPNALCLGPDGYLYFPLVPLGEVWRVKPDHGAPERVAGGLNIPTAVKIDADGCVIIAESGAGRVTKLDPKNGRLGNVAQTQFGIDNLALGLDGTLYVSHFTDGAVTAFGAAGAERSVVRGGMMGPYGLSVDGLGNLIVADGMSLAVIDTKGVLTRPAMLLEHGFPGYVRGVALCQNGDFVCTNSAGGLMRYRPGTEATVLAAGLVRPMDVEVATDGDILVCEAGAGKVLRVNAAGAIDTLADGLSEPAGLFVAGDGKVFVSEAGAGRVIAIEGGSTSVVLQGLSQPHGVAGDRDALYVVDRDVKTLHRVDLRTRETSIVARGLPVGPGSGRKINALPGIADLMPGPLSQFADLAFLPDGRLCIGCDGDGSIVTLHAIA